MNETLPSSLVPSTSHLQLWGSLVGDAPLPPALVVWWPMLQSTFQLVDAGPLRPGEGTPPGWAETVTTGARW